MRVELLCTPTACDRCGGSTIRRQAQALDETMLDGTLEAFTRTAHAAARVPMAYRVGDGVVGITVCGHCFALPERPVGTLVAEQPLPAAAFQWPAAEEVQ